jgi:hypothetical protein
MLGKYSIFGMYDMGHVTLGSLEMSQESTWLLSIILTPVSLF